MANPHRGQYRLEVDGKQYMLEFKSDAICSIEAELNLSLGAIQKQLADPQTSRMAMVRVLFNSALVPRDDTVFGKMWPDEIFVHVTKALNLAFGVTEAEATAASAPASPTNPASLSTDGIGPDYIPTGSGSASSPRPSGNTRQAKSAA